MGIEYKLVRDDTHEIYDLGKFTGDWVTALGGDEDVPWEGFVVTRDVDRLTAAFEESWRGVPCPAGYLRHVAEDILRWAGPATVRFTSDGSFQGWRRADGTWDDGRYTGSRYREDHPDWPALTT